MVGTGTPLVGATSQGEQLLGALLRKACSSSSWKTPRSRKGGRWGGHGEWWCRGAWPLLYPVTQVRFQGYPRAMCQGAGTVAQQPIRLVCAEGTKNLNIWRCFGGETRGLGVPPQIKGLSSLWPGWPHRSKTDQPRPHHPHVPTLSLSCWQSCRETVKKTRASLSHGMTDSTLCTWLTSRRWEPHSLQGDKGP